MKKVLLFAFVVILTACSAQPTQSQATTTSTVTVTLSPPTATVIPTPTVASEFLAIQTQVATAEICTIMGNGSIEGPRPDGSIGPIEGIKLNPDGKGYTIMVNGAPVVIDADKVSITDAGINIEGYIFDAATGNATEGYKIQTWIGMDKSVRIDVYNKAPEIAGYVKEKSKNDSHALYRNVQTGKIDTARNLLSGEVYPIMEISMDPNNPLDITYDNLTSGLLARSERAMCPRSASAVPGVWGDMKIHGLDGKLNANALNFLSDKKYVTDPSSRPEELCSFSRLEIDLGRGQQGYIVIGMGIVNADQTQSFIHTPRLPKDVAISIESMNKSTTGIIVELVNQYPNYPEEGKVMELNPGINELAKILKNTNNIPDELQETLINTCARRWDS